MKSKVWFPYKTKDHENCKCKLFCFNHAGGNSRIFRDWINLDENIEVIPIEIPGRQKRISEGCETDFTKLMNAVAAEVATAAGIDKVFIYGHSLGAALAFNLAEMLENKYHKKVEGLFVAGRQSPFDEDVSPYRTSMGTENLRLELMRLGDTPKELLDDKDFMNFYLPIVYSDYQLAENYAYDGNVINCPIYAMCGDTDMSADANRMKNWQSVTNNFFHLKEFKGGHFFAYSESAKEVKEFIAEHIGKIIAI